MRVPPSEGSRLLGQLVAIWGDDRAARLEVLPALIGGRLSAYRTDRPTTPKR